MVFEIITREILNPKHGHHKRGKDKQGNSKA